MLLKMLFFCFVLLLFHFVFRFRYLFCLFLSLFPHFWNPLIISVSNDFSRLFLFIYLFIYLFFMSSSPVYVLMSNHKTAKNVIFKLFLLLLLMRPLNMEAKVYHHGYGLLFLMICLLLKAHIHPRCIARRGTVFIYENHPILFEWESSEKAISDHEYFFPPARVVEETRMNRLSSYSQ